MDARDFLSSARALAAMVVGSELRDRWDDPSVLEGYTIGELAAHAARGVLTVQKYLGERQADPKAELVDAVGYLEASLADHDPLTSDFHASVRERAAKGAEVGPDALVEKITTATQNLGARFLDDVDGQREIAVLGGLRITMAEYLRTRVLELAIHLDDLALSLQVEAPPLPETVWDDLAALLSAYAIRRHGAREVALAMSRTERTDRLAAI